MAKIMVIDDEAEMGDLIRKIFEPEGHEVVSEIDPEKAIELVRKENPDCLLLDIMMPKIDGVEVLSRVRKFNKDLAVVMITAYGSVESAIESMKLKAVDYISKPISAATIKNIVKRCLESRGKQD